MKNINFNPTRLVAKVGDTVELQGSTFTIVGVFHGGTALEAGALIMPIDQLQQISSLQGKVSGFHVRLKPAPAGESAERYLKRAQAEIEAALSELPASQREVFLAHEIDGRSFADISAETGVGVKTLLSRKHYAVKRLRKRLQRIYDESGYERRSK